MNRRLAVLWGAVGFLVVILVALAVALKKASEMPWGLTDRLTLAGDEVATAGLLMAAVAGVVAVLAYGVAFRTPRLLPEFKFFWCEAQTVTLVTGEPDGIPGTPLLIIRPNPAGPGSQIFRQLELSVRVSNEARWSAQNPALSIDMDGLLLPYDTGLPQGWRIDKRNALRSIIAIGWEGPAIHGHQTRDLPDIDLHGLRASKARPTLTILLYAEGFSEGYDYDVELLTLAEWQAKYPDAEGGGFN